MVMGVISEWAIPRSYRMMKGFRVGIFKFVNKQGKSTLGYIPQATKARSAVTHLE
jgi:catalase